MKEAEKIIAKYPAGYQASAVIPLLDLAQRQVQIIVKFVGWWLDSCCCNEQDCQDSLDATHARLRSGLILHNVQQARDVS